MKPIYVFAYLFVFSVVIFCQSQVFARAIRVQTFSSAHNTTYVGIEDALLNDQPNDQPNRNESTVGRIYFYGDYSLVREPWIDLDDKADVYQGTLINKAQVLNLGMGWLARSNVQLGFELPVEILTTENSTNVNSKLDGSSTTGLGDLKAYAKWQMFKTENGFAMSLRPSLFLPTGFHAANNYQATASSDEKTGIGASWGSVGAGLMLAIEKKFKYATLALNVGVENHPNSFLEGHTSLSSTTPEYTKVDKRTIYPAGLGVFIPVTEKFALNLEKNILISQEHNEYTQPGEGYGGLRYQATPAISVHAGYGGGKAFDSNGKNVSGERYVAGLKMPLWLPVNSEPSQSAVTERPKQVEPVKVETVRYVEKKLEVDETIEFDSGKATLTEAGKAVLDKVAGVLLENQSKFKKIIVEGHTDHKGSASLNKNLSEKRALTAKNYLISKGLNSTLLQSKGYGKEKPIFPIKNITEEQMQKNRRVEFVIHEK
jgi:outer membrane protein OmpA-like peptidoglycan-associated protein